MQLVKAELPAGESESIGHAVHVELAVAPSAAEYLPWTQSLQASDPAAAL